MIVNPTREQKLLMNLVRASSAGRQSRQLEAFFDNLDDAGWLVELARVHVRLCSGVSQPHTSFAHTLLIQDSHAYRLMLTRDDGLRDAAISVARLLIKLNGENIMERVSKSMEFNRYISIASNSGRPGMNRGRRLGASFATTDEVGEQLEDLRLRAGLRLKHWAVRIGTSENTYRRKLEAGIVPPEWLEAARDTVQRQQANALQRREDAVAVTELELAFAFGRVWEAYTKSFERLTGTAQIKLPETEAEKAARYAKEDEDLLRFVPSPEEDMEFNDVELGSVDKTDRVDPKNLDEETA